MSFSGAAAVSARGSFWFSDGRINFRDEERERGRGDHSDRPFVVQGWPKRWTPGSVNMRRKNCVLLPAAGKRTQLFHLTFTEPWVHLLGHPCIYREMAWHFGTGFSRRTDEGTAHGRTTTFRSFRLSLVRWPSSLVHSPWPLLRFLRVILSPFPSFIIASSFENAVSRLRYGPYNHII